ncbi:Pr6Pr family membrane protein [Glaciimonas immobilis]|uniref:FAR-17a/AIG1-like protein n=1 Tax=Glaciimonas immobilis TaxID=728004 RepID=A0A840RW08_9BURK|nr:Pr6Pr family membrane protein [Glaciimonas immobilis]KAF3996076.1 Pr6Pr family membrane protein [Glaciimonas immobilis]MBB5201783.1 hypothetical protein [Glaciimonas immobilis]
MERKTWNIGVAAIGAVIAWYGLGVELFVTNERMLAQGRPLQDAIISLSAYFTILTNLLVALGFTSAALRSMGDSGQAIPGARNYGGGFFARPFVLSGIAPSIALVCIVYNLELRQLSHYTGWARLADELLHVVMPVAFILYWYLLVPKAMLRWRDSLIWAIYPIVYLGYALIRGASSGRYAYPFIDVAKLGYPAVLLNGVGILIGFLAMSLLFIAVDRRKSAHLQLT